MKKKEFTLTLDAAKATRAQMPWIKSLFNDIEVRFEDSSTSARTKIEWLSIIGESESTCEKAKNYITSLTSPSAKAIIKIPPKFKEELLKDDSELLKSFERESAAVIIVDSDTDEISIQGVDELLIVLAKSLIDETLQKHQQEQTKTVDPNITEICDSVKKFAIKLGYNDDDIMTAVHKCNTEGKVVNANTLLQELVKGCPQKLKDSILKSDLGKDDEKLFVEIARSIAEVTTAQTTTASSSRTFCETLRDVVIDGSNVAMCHGHKEVFSCTGIDIVVDWFKQRGHDNIVVFVPQWRQEAPKGDSPITDQHILDKLQKEKILVFTPSRKINGRRVVCYDDRFIVKHAFETDGIIVSNDNFRDLQKENQEWKSFLEQRLLMYSFVKDRFMAPDDPLGRCGPTLNEFLRKGPLNNRPCPYKNKCTYGSKCRYYHAEKDISTNTLVSQSLGHAPLLSTSTANSMPKRVYPPTKPSYFPETSCGYEQRQLENNYIPTHEIIARGCASLPSDYIPNSHSSVQDRDWQHKQQQIPSPVYQHSAYYNTSSQLPTQQRHSQYYLQAPSWNNYSMHKTTTYSPQMYPQSRTPPPANNYILPTHQPHVQYPQRTPNPSFSIMPGYVDPRTINQYYRPPCQINSPYVQPMALPLETSVVSPTTRSTTQYLLRHDPYSQKDEHVRLQRLLEMFPARRQVIYRVLSEHPYETNLNKLASYVLAM